MRTRNNNRKWMGIAAGAMSGLATTATLAQPVLEVRVNSVVMTPNQEVNLGQADLGNSIPLIVVLRNIGSQDLLFTESPPIFVFGGFESDFTLIQPPLETGNKLSPNGSTAFRVDFTPSRVSPYISTRVFISTNSTPSIYPLTLVGTGNGPIMVVKSGSSSIRNGAGYSFPPTPVGQSATTSFTIENIGNRPLRLTGVPPIVLAGNTAFSVVEQPAAEIAPGGESEFSLSFTPTGVQDHTGSLSIVNNEASLTIDELYDIALSGRGHPPVAPNQPVEATEPDAGQDDAGDADAGQPDDGQEQAADDETYDVDGYGDDQDVQQGDAVDAVAADELVEEILEAELNEMLDRTGVRGGLCGFGAPFGLAGAMLMLAGRRSVLRRR
jgi:hypothetical protein